MCLIWEWMSMEHICCIFKRIWSNILHASSFYSAFQDCFWHPHTSNHNEKRVQKRQQTLNTHTQSMEVSPASALHIEKSLSPRPWALMHSATSDQWANICAAPNAGKSSPSRCLLAAMHANQYLMPFSQLNLWILVIHMYIYISAPKILVSQKALIRTSTATFLRQNSQSSSIMIWKAGRLGDAADRICYNSMHQLHIYHAHTAVSSYMPVYSIIHIRVRIQPSYTNMNIISA